MTTAPHVHDGCTTDCAVCMAPPDVIASNGFTVWAPVMQPDPTRPDCERHSLGDPDYPCVCPEATEVDRADCIARGLHDTANGYCKACGAQ